MDCSTEAEDDEIKQILDELKKENDNYEHNKEIQKKLANISALCFTKNVESLVNKLFRTSVKTCDCISDFQALDIYDNNKDICIFDNKTTFYLVQIFVSHTFQSRLIDSNWIVAVCITNDDQNVCKIVNIKKLMPSEVVNVLVPFSKSTKPSVVETRLFSPSGDNYWPNIKVSSVLTDVSYHLIPLYACKSLNPVKNSPLFEISKLYTDSIKLKPKEMFFEYTFKCLLDVRNVFEAILKNCIHRLNINQMQMLATTNGVSNLHLLESENEASVTLDTENKTLKIKAPSDSVGRIKKFLIENMKEETKCFVDASLLTRLENLQMQLHVELSNKNICFENVKMIHSEYRALISELPL